ncbi:hemagglutinin repeat-containing protein [Marinomonas sp. TW1]|uniref:hemagglutinin repeat-containing protein n=1 Tax=Marinomonas sp. TW1 TaxID=1561203 RepID=UPI001E29766E|nr:hemagglutinin repeat-containing protein [Marinomonas sp. TW1]
MQGNIINEDGALVHADTDLTLDAEGNLTNTNSTIEALNQVDIKSQNLTSSGTILAQDGSLTIDTNQVTNQGALAGKGITINATELNNSSVNAKIYSTDAIALNVQGNISNENGALVHADTSIDLNAFGDVINTGSVMEAVNDISLLSQDFSNDANSALLAQNGTLSIAIGKPDENNEQIMTGPLTNKGVLTGKEVELTATAIHNDTSDSQISATGDVTIIASQGEVRNTHGASIRANDLLIIEAATDLINNDSQIESGHDIRLSSQNIENTAEALIRANDSITMDWRGTLTNDNAKIEAQNNIQTTQATQSTEGEDNVENPRSGSLTNQSSGYITALNGNLDLTLGSLTNYGSIGANQVYLNTSNLLNNGSSGAIVANEHLDLYSTGNINNKSGAVLYSLGSGHLETENTLTNSSARIETVRDLTVNAQTILNKKNRFRYQFETHDLETSSYAPGFWGGFLVPEYNGLFSITTTTPYIVEDSEQAYLMTQGNLTLKGNIDNQYSTISAIGDLDFDVNKYELTSLSLEKTVHYKQFLFIFDPCGGPELQMGICHRMSESELQDYVDSQRIPDIIIKTPVALATSTFTSNGNITGQAKSVSSIGSADSVSLASVNGDLDATLSDSEQNLAASGIGASQLVGSNDETVNTSEQPQVVADSNETTINTSEQPQVVADSNETTINTSEQPQVVADSNETTINTSEQPQVVADSNETTINTSDQPQVTTGSNDATINTSDQPQVTADSNEATINTSEQPQVTTGSNETTINTSEQPQVTADYNETTINTPDQPQVTTGSNDATINTSEQPQVVADSNETTINTSEQPQVVADSNETTINTSGQPQVTTGSNDATINTSEQPQVAADSNDATINTSEQPQVTNSNDSSLGNINLETVKSRRDAIFNDLNVDSFVQSALYTSSENPDSDYLIQTNPLFTNYKNFVSSDYMLNKMVGDDQGRTGKTASRLGDGFLEQNLVREQILSYTGFQTLPDQVDIESAYATLMDNALEEYTDLQLSVGIELTDKQVAQLKQPIVWMVSETVQTDSGPQEALVPKVYFSNTSDMTLRPDGALIAATNIDIQVDGDLVNSGAIVARSDLSLSGENISNSGNMMAGNNASLNASSDIGNSGSIQVNGALNLVAGGNITSETQNQTISTQSGIFSNTQTLLGETASLQGGTVNLVAGNDISLIGSEVSANDQIFAQAGNDFTLASLEVTNSSDIGGHYNSQNSTTNHLTNSLSANSIQLSAGNNFISGASAISALDQLSIHAANDLTLSSVENTTESSARRRNASSVTHQVNSLAASQIQLSTGNTFTSQGAQLAADNDLILSANNIDLLAVKDIKDAYSFVGGGGNSTEKRTHNESITGTDLSAGGALTLVSQNDIFSKGSTLSSGEDLTLAAGGDVILTTETAHNSSYQQVKKKKKKLFGTKRSTTTTTSESLINQGTNLTSGGDLTIASGVDILLEGSKANAEGDISVQAAGDIELLSAVDQSSQRYQKQKKGTFKVKAKDKGSIKQTAVTSDLVGGGNISLDSGSNITLEGATLAANDTLSIGTDAVTQNANGQYVNDKGELAGNVTVTTQALESSEWSESSSSFRGVFKDLAKGLAVVASVGTAGLVHGEIKVGESDATRTDTLTQHTTQLSSTDLNLTAQQDLTLIGAQVAVSDTANLTAQNVTIDAAQERTVTSTSHTDQTVSGEGASFSSEKGELTLASITETDHTERTTTTANTWAGSSLQAGNLNIKAVKNVAIIASDVSVQNDASIEGENVLIGGREDTYDTTNDSITKTKTLTVGVKNAYADTYLAVRALDQAKDAVKDAKAAYDDAKQKVADGKLPKSDLDFYKANLAVATANVANATTAAYNSSAAAAATAASGGTGFYATAGVTTQTDTTSTTTSQGQWQGANIQVGGNTSLTSDNNLNVEGSVIATAGQLALNADNINITAGQNTYSEDTESHSEGASVSASMKADSTAFSGSVNASRSQSQYASTNYVNSQLSAGSVVSNSDTLTIKGGNLNGQNIDITTDQLVIESLQDTSSGSNSSVGMNLSASLGNNDAGWKDVMGSSGQAPSPSTNNGSAAGNLASTESTTPSSSTGVSGFGGNIAVGQSESAWVAQQSGISGGQVTIKAKDTTITGGVIAAVDSNGQTTDQLTLTTQSLSISDLEDTSSNKNLGLGYSVSGLGQDASNSGKDSSTSTYSASFNGAEKEQTTKATIGLGNVTVGGTNIDEQAQFADLNRDITNSQEITKDVERGGLDANLTVDNRMLSKTGWEDIANDISATHDAVASGVDYVADEIAVLGNDLPEEYRGQLGETGEELVDDWIRADYTDEQIAEALERDKVQESLANLESIKGKSQEDFLAEVNQQEQNQATETSTQSDISVKDGEVRLGLLEITDSNNSPTALAVGTDALGKLNQEVQALAEDNPVLSNMLSYGMDAVGGPVKAAVGILVDEGFSAVAGDELAQVGEAVTSYVGAKIQNVDVDEYRELRTDEQNDTALYNSLESGESMINTDDGVGMVATILGVDLGRRSVKSATSHDSGDGAVSSGSMGDGVGSATTNINAARLNNQLTSEEITSHHAWDKHRDEFPELNSKQEFQQHIESVINNSTSVRYTSDGRTIYLDSKTKTVVIRDATNSESPGTAWRPSGDWDTYIKNAEKFGDIPKVTSPQATTPQLDLPKKGLEVD